MDQCIPIQKNDWNKLCEYAKNVIPNIIFFSNLRETLSIKESNNKLFNVEKGKPLLPKET